MGVIIPFPARPAQSSQRWREEGCRVFIFSGVRIEREPNIKPKRQLPPGRQGKPRLKPDKTA